MGYETELLIGRKLDEPHRRVKTYFIKLASLELSKVYTGNFGKLIERIQKKRNAKKYPRTYYYEGYCKKCDEEFEIKTDCYGAPLRLVPIKEVLEAIVTDNKLEPYRRFKMAIALLREMIRGFKGEELYCVLRGH
jgi:hypothetical protein